MKVQTFADREGMAESAASQAAHTIRRAIARHGQARIIAATGASQFRFLEKLTSEQGIEWDRVEMFHLDEYLDLPQTHPASFRKYLRERLIDKVGIKNFHLIDGERNPSEVIAEITADIKKAPIDIAFVGIGENGHLAFNDPPADFETDESYIVVDLDEECRRQQLGEGWFQGLEDVPRRAISMTVRQVLRANEIICVVPDARKAIAMKKCLEGEISPMFPGSILRTHPNTYIYLDKESSAMLSSDTAGAIRS